MLIECLAALTVSGPPGAPPARLRPELWHPRAFFDPGSAELRPEATEMAAKVALYFSRSRCGGGPGLRAVTLDARADRVGSEAANLALSRRRAEAVARALVREGVDPSAIEITARSEGGPVVSIPTEDGVAEPLNRAVWVDFRR